MSMIMNLFVKAFALTKASAFARASAFFIRLR